MSTEKQLNSKDAFTYLVANGMDRKIAKCLIDEIHGQDKRGIDISNFVTREYLDAKLEGLEYKMESKLEGLEYKIESMGDKLRTEIANLEVKMVNMNSSTLKVIMGFITANTIAIICAILTMKL
jgi:hypothetical protein